MEHGAPVLPDLHEEARRKCVPISATIELTLACNLRCVHCYNFDRDRPFPSRHRELSFDEWTRVLRELKEAGTLFLSLTGGEALVHPRFWDILTEATRLRFAVTLLSNGTTLTDRIVDRLAAFPSVMGASISLYGATAETHEAVTRARGSFERTVRSIDRLRRRGLHAHVKFVLLEQNAGEVDRMLRLAESNGWSHQIDPTITGRYDGTATSLQERLQIPTVRRLYEGPLRSKLEKRPEGAFSCNCARTTCAVLSNGNVTPCIAVPLAAGNVREDSFGTVWRDAPFFRRIRTLRLEDFRSCAPCPLRPWCRRTPGPPSALHGDFTGIDPWQCEEAAAIRDVLSPAQPCHTSNVLRPTRPNGRTGCSPGRACYVPGPTT